MSGKQVGASTIDSLFLYEPTTVVYAIVSVPVGYRGPIVHRQVNNVVVHLSGAAGRRVGKLNALIVNTTVALRDKIITDGVVAILK